MFVLLLISIWNIVLTNRIHKSRLQEVIFEKADANNKSSIQHNPRYQRRVKEWQVTLGIPLAVSTVSNFVPV